MSVQTAEEFLKRDESGVYTEVDITKAMIDFAKLHVEACKKEVIDNVETCIGGDGSPLVSIASILNSYPLDKIQ
jgi:hypothetical protein